MKTLALVESATQLLNVAEWAHSAGETDGLRVAVLAPTDPHTVRQIARVADLVRTLDVEVRVHPVRTPGPRAVTGGLEVVRDLARVGRLLIGDPFSRFIQTLLPLAPAEQVVVVDDGTATWEYAACIAAGKPLVRWQKPLRVHERRAERATRLLSPSEWREISVFSCLDDAAPPGAVPLANRYTWTRTRRRPDVLDGEVDVLGTSLVDTGVVQRRCYLDALAAIARGPRPVRYLAHRRESASLVAAIATIPGLRVVRADLPVELALREGPVAGTVITFPSTAAHTLPVVLSDLAVHLDVRRVDPAWFTPGTTSHARAFVARIAALAPVAPAPVTPELEPI